MNDFKKIEAIIRVEKLEEVRIALEKEGFVGLTVTEVKGRGSQKGITLEWRAGEYRLEFLPKLKLELVIDDAMVEKGVKTIIEAAKTDRIGDGKIFVSPVAEVYRIRTEEKGKVAL